MDGNVNLVESQIQKLLDTLRINDTTNALTQTSVRDIKAAIAALQRKAMREKLGV